MTDMKGMSRPLAEEYSTVHYWEKCLSIWGFVSMA